MTSEDIELRKHQILLLLQVFHLSYAPSVTMADVSSFTELESIFNDRNWPSKQVNVQIRIVAQPSQTDGGRLSWMVEDLLNPNFRTFMVCFHQDIEVLHDSFEFGGCYELRGARVGDNRLGSHYPYR